MIATGLSWGILTPVSHARHFKTLNCRVDPPVPRIVRATEGMKLLGQLKKMIIDMHAEVCTVQTVEEILSRPFEIESHVFI